MKHSLILAAGVLIGHFGLTGQAQGAPPALGPSSGGGGFAVVCPETPVSDESVELLDLYEGQHHLGLKMTESTGDLAQDYINSADRTYTLQGDPDLAEKIRDEIFENLKKFFYATTFLEEPSQLPIARDLGRVGFIARGCNVEQIAYFDDASGLAYVRKDRWDQMDPLSQAALVQHELWFHHYRQFKHQTSKLARATVAHIFSKEGVRPLREGLTSDFFEYTGYPLDFLAPLPDGGSLSTGELTQVYVAGPMHYPKDHMLLQFTILAGRPFLTQTLAVLPIDAWELEPAGGEFRGCVLVDKGQKEQIVTAELRGSMSEGLSVRVTLTPGKPVTLDLIEDSKVVGTSYVGQAPECRGTRYKGI